MQIKSTYKFFDLYLLVAGIIIIFCIATHYLHQFRSLALVLPFGIVLWLVVKNRTVRTLTITDQNLTVVYFQSFKTKTVHYPLSTLRFDLDSYDISYKYKRYNYVLRIFEHNIKRWELSTLEGFKREDFVSLINYISHAN
jgi:glucose-6-phosphate-specific signal transduction histidine kinase